MQAHSQAEDPEPACYGQRKRDRDATQAALLGSAKLRFAADGYNHTSIRDIAADVGVNQALVYRYFGSKEQLFEAAAGDHDPLWDLLQGPVEELPDRVAREVLDMPSGVDGPDPMLALLRSTDHEETRERLRRIVRQGFTEGLADRLSGPRRRVRAELLAALLVGTGVLRAVVKTPALADTDGDELAEPLRQVVRVLLGDDDET